MGKSDHFQYSAVIWFKECGQVINMACDSHFSEGIPDLASSRAKNSGNFWILDPLPGDIGCLRKMVS